MIREELTSAAKNMHHLRVTIEITVALWIVSNTEQNARPDRGFPTDFDSTTSLIQRHQNVHLRSLCDYYVADRDEDRLPIQDSYLRPR